MTKVIYSLWNWQILKCMQKIGHLYSAMSNNHWQTFWWFPIFYACEGILFDKSSSSCIYAVKCQNSLRLSLASKWEQMQTADHEEAPSHEGELCCSLNVTCSLTGSCNRCFKDQWEDAWKWTETQPAPEEQRYLTMEGGCEIAIELRKWSTRWWIVFASTLKLKLPLFFLGSVRRKS